MDDDDEVVPVRQPGGSWKPKRGNLSAGMPKGGREQYSELVRCFELTLKQRKGMATTVDQEFCL